MEKLFNAFSAQCSAEQFQLSHDKEANLKLSLSPYFEGGGGWWWWWGVIYPKPLFFTGKDHFYSLFNIRIPVTSLMLQPVVKNLDAKFLLLNISQSCLVSSTCIRSAKALTINSSVLVVCCFGYQYCFNLIDLF